MLRKELTLIDNKLILPHLTYGILPWGYSVKKIYRLQKRSIRIKNRSHYTANTEPIFKKLKLLNINNLYKLNYSNTTTK